MMSPPRLLDLLVFGERLRRYRSPAPPPARQGGTRGAEVSRVTTRRLVPVAPAAVAPPRLAAAITATASSALGPGVLGLRAAHAVRLRAGWLLGLFHHTKHN